MQRYKEALAATDPGRILTVEPGSEEEAQAIARFNAFYEVFSVERIKERVRAVYAEDAYFRDPFKDVTGIDAIEAYFVHSTEAIEACTFDIVEVSSTDGNYYFRWVMDLKLKNYKKGETIEGVGVTHVRFNREGRVVFHQDYWDGGIVYERLPLLGWLVNKVRTRI